MKSPYSPNKIFHHRHWIKQVRAGKFPPPIFLEVIPTNRCNQNCKFCAYRNPSSMSSQLFNPRDEIPFNRLRTILTDCASLGIKAIEVTGGGEPLCHPQFLDLCQLILDLDMDLGLVTNGSRWTNEHTEVLQHASWVRFSVDAGYASTYQKLRRCSPEHYDTVCNAIASLSKVRKGRTSPIVGVGFVITQENWSQVYSAALNARTLGANNIRISAVMQDKGAEYFKGFAGPCDILCKKTVQELSTNDFRVFNLFGPRLADYQQGSPQYRRCYFQQAATYLGADLNLYRCCVLAYNRMGIIGSLADQTISDLWNSPKTEKSITQFNAQACEQCMFNNKNDTIAYALDPEPTHVNFI